MKRVSRAAVTGGAGFIGSHVVEMLLAEGVHVLVVDDLSVGDSSVLATDVELYVADVASHDAYQALTRFSPEVVVHCAAQSSVPRSISDPILDARTNILGSINVSQAALTLGDIAMVYLSSGGAIYSSANNVPITELDAVQPMSPYGLSKLFGEQYLRLKFGPRIRILRLANVYGQRQRAGNEGAVVSTFIDSMLRDHEVFIYGDGSQTRDFVAIQDVVSAVHSAIIADNGFTVNIGTGVETSILALFGVLAELTGYSRPVKFKPQRLGDVNRNALDISHAKAAMNWEPNINLVDGLRYLVASRRV